MDFAAAPVILVSTGFGDEGEYLGLTFTRPLVELGALPVVAPYVEEPDALAALVRRVDGVVLGFGPDIEPWRYGAAPSPLTGDHVPARDAFELALIDAALRAGVPLLGVCRGLQVLNVALGGTLRLDHSTAVPPADRHPGGDWERWREAVAAAVGGAPPPEHPSHPIVITPGSVLARALGVGATVNSYHHQAIERLGRGLVPVAQAPDGVVEAVELPSAEALTLGVQWELQESVREDARFVAVFGLLVDAARAHAGRAAPDAGADRRPGPRNAIGTERATAAWG
jgi:putative glutamine amidotransferase